MAVKSFVIKAQGGSTWKRMRERERERLYTKRKDPYKKQKTRKKTR